MRALPLGGEQHWHVRDAHASRQAWQYIGEVSDRIDVGELAATEQSVCDRGALRTGVAAGK